MELDTGNHHLVTSHQGKVIMMLPPRGPLDPEQAIMLAAWLVVSANMESPVTLGIQEAITAVENC